MDSDSGEQSDGDLSPGEPRSPLHLTAGQLMCALVLTPGQLRHVGPLRSLTRLATARAGCVVSSRVSEDLWRSSRCALDVAQHVGGLWNCDRVKYAPGDETAF